MGQEAVKGEALPYHSAGQRPALGQRNAIKAEGLAEHDARAQVSFIRKAFSLDYVARPFRRALPYAVIRKAFGLVEHSTSK